MNPLVAIDPVESRGQAFERFCEAVKLFQEKKLLSKATIASAIHASLYMVPYEWYQDMKGQYAKEALDRIESACRGRFAFHSAKVLQSNSSADENLVAQLSRLGKRQGCDILVVGSNARKWLPYWILGSFAETAALTSTLPVLVVKPHWKESPYSSEVRLLVAVDARVPPSSNQIHWIANAAKASSAEVDLAYVRPKHQMIVDSVRPPKMMDDALADLKIVQKALRTEGVHAEIHVLDEAKSLAHALNRFAERRNIWLTIAICAKRSFPFKHLLGSTARRLLSLTERPLSSLHMEH